MSASSAIAEGTLLSQWSARQASGAMPRWSRIAPNSPDAAAISAKETRIVRIGNEGVVSRERGEDFRCRARAHALAPTAALSKSRA